MSRQKPAYRKTTAASVPPAPEYVTKELAAKRLGLSVRRVLELSARGLLKRRTVRDPVTKRRQTVFLAADLVRFTGVRVPGPAPRPRPGRRRPAPPRRLPRRCGKCGPSGGTAATRGRFRTSVARTALAHARPGGRIFRPASELPAK